MKIASANFGIPLVPTFVGTGVVAKIVAAVVFVSMAAGGAVYVLLQKSYAPQTIEFDGQVFSLHTETWGGDATHVGGDVIHVYEHDKAMYVAVYADDSEFREKMGHERFLNYQVMYAANPEAEFVQGGVYSANAVVASDFEAVRKDPRTLLFQMRKAENGDLMRLFVQDQFENGKDLRVRGKRCGASSANAFACISYWVWVRNEYATPQEWVQQHGAERLDHWFEVLSAYPLRHNKELLADMGTAFSQRG